MSQENVVTPDPLKIRRAYWLSIAFTVGVPFGIALGAIAAAIFDLVDIPHNAAWGVLIGASSAVLIGSLSATVGTQRNTRWTRREFIVNSDDEWAAVVRAFNVVAVREHYFLVQREPDYVAYAPMLYRPVAAGPLTVSSEYLGVVVTRLNDTQVTITGPERMLKALVDSDEFEAVGLSEQDAHADS